MKTLKFIWATSLCVALSMGIISCGHEHEYVDLGLSVKWATCNLGATKPEEYGLYYQWGDTQGYGSDTSDGKYFYWTDENDNVSYKWSNDRFGNSFTKYNKVEDNAVLDREDDAASIALGDGWRMPTNAEWMELRENCTWTWTKDYNGTGVSGRVVTSNKIGYTDRSIFLPAAGYRYRDGLPNVGSDGNYWSSQLSTFSSYCACSVYFTWGNFIMSEYYDRCIGQSVRPVLE